MGRPVGGKVPDTGDGGTPHTGTMGGVPRLIGIGSKSCWSESVRTASRRALVAGFSLSASRTAIRGMTGREGGF